MNNEQKNILIEAIEQTSPWERIPTTVEGVYLVKTPERNNHTTVFVELNPSINGQPIKKRGVFLKNTDEYNTFNRLIQNQKIKELLEVINQYYGKSHVPKIEI